MVYLEPFPCNHRIIFKPSKNVEGGGCHMDVYLPANSDGKTLPIAIYYHGGGFVAGETVGIPFAQVAYLLERGFVVVSVAYRLFPQVILPAIREDLLDSYKYIQLKLNDELNRLGSKVTIDGNQACAVGFSAGGGAVLYLTADLIGYNSTHEPSQQLPALKCILPFYPMADLQIPPPTRAGIPEPTKTLKEKLDEEPTFKKDYEEYMAYPVVPCEWNPMLDKPLSKADPSEGFTLGSDRGIVIGLIMGSINGWYNALIGQDFPYPDSSSPLQIISSSFPPTCILMASEDKTLLNEVHAKPLYEKLKALGVDTTMFVGEGMEHGEAEALPHQKARWETEGDRWWKDSIVPCMEWLTRKMAS